MPPAVGTSCKRKPVVGRSKSSPLSPSLQRRALARRPSLSAVCIVRKCPTQLTLFIFLGVTQVSPLEVAVIPSCLPSEGREDSVLLFSRYPRSGTVRAPYNRNNGILHCTMRCSQFV